jgi:hypothetical protein
MSTTSVCRPGATPILATDAETTGNVPLVASSTVSHDLEQAVLLVVLVSHSRNITQTFYANHSAAAQIVLTVLIMTTMVFLLGFFADPILNLYFDPWSTLMPWASSSRGDYFFEPEDEPDSWTEHFAKGFAGMGVLGFLKVIVTSPLSYFRIGGGRGRATGRDRYEQVSWIIILIGVGTFLAVRSRLQSIC